VLAQRLILAWTGAGFHSGQGHQFVYAPLLLRGENFVNKALGVFSNESWEFLDVLTASGGIRLSRERK